ncbi:hypothetical protein B1813_18880 [Saccharomonospora piscinae]|uniref:Uncharacterized protein n=1 Tax=Saccharomonospora piscinae TaxID=687388 RepID=A0A1V8ZY89_SACPI|nr:hypothetical protein [Saccharomonospora piscinae]OQO89907.1 hypothetical protein B1813_18880 [Saccharomonospora piscinae]
MTPGDLSPALLGQISHCECGTESPAGIPAWLDGWEDDHRQWHCPIDTSPPWDDVLERWAYPRIPSFARRPAPIEHTTDHTPPAWSRTRLRSEHMRDWLTQHRETR